MYNVEAVRKDFPILDRKVYGKPLIYLDNAATSQKPLAMIEAISDYYRRYNANIHRGIHCLSEEATAAYEAVRQKVCRLINASSPECVVFTRNTTEAINLISYSWGTRNLDQGDEILLTEMEHHSNLVPWLRLSEETGATLKFAHVSEDGTLSLDEIQALIGPRTKLVTMVHVSNSLGTINPVREVAEQAHKVGALMLVDAAQSVPHMPVDVQALGCDFLAFSGHKMLGPTGVGVLYARSRLLESMEPFLSGGEMIKKVALDGATWNDIPFRFEAGTPNVADVIGLGSAIDYLLAIGMDAIREHDMEITDYTLRAIRQMEDITVYGPSDIEKRGGVVAFNIPNVHPHDVGTILDQEGIAIRAGHHCTMPLMSRYGIAGTARASFYLYNTLTEADALIAGIKKVKAIFHNP